MIDDDDSPDWPDICEECTRNATYRLDGHLLCDEHYREAVDRQRSVPKPTDSKPQL